MSRPWRWLATARTVIHALKSPRRGAPVCVCMGEMRRMERGELLGGVERFVDAAGELRLLFPGVLPVAAPFLLFRLKRQGFSRCRAEAGSEGIVVTGRR